MAERDRAAPAAAPPPPPFAADAATAGQLCSICQTAVIAGEQVCKCPYCGLPFHMECWLENRGCSAYGCQGAPKTVKVEAAHPVSNAWGDEKPCPACGKTIKAEALKCRFCGEAFGTRDVISREEFKSREYEGKEFTTVRNKVIGLFLLSALGCLAPLGLIFNGMLIKQGNLMGIDYKRLPATLKAAVWCSVGVSALLCFIMVLLMVFDR
ncbi:MAG: hypothetical protein HY291_16235 [Planctomycetes bacterium]|nr:hypothetical protein [Planctomycetota bacterium]